jgi:hypothetical protein
MLVAPIMLMNASGGGGGYGYTNHKYFITDDRLSDSWTNDSGPLTVGSGTITVGSGMWKVSTGASATSEALHFIKSPTYNYAIGKKIRSHIFYVTIPGNSVVDAINFITLGTTSPFSDYARIRAFRSGEDGIIFRSNISGLSSHNNVIYTGTTGTEYWIELEITGVNTVTTRVLDAAFSILATEVNTIRVSTFTFTAGISTKNYIQAHQSSNGIKQIDYTT